MKETKYTVKYTTSFKKDYKRAIKRGLKIELLEQVVALLAMGEPLPDTFPTGRSPFAVCLRALPAARYASCERRESRACAGETMEKVPAGYDDILQKT